LAFATSSGVATHHSREQARRLALLELVERDAVMRTWFAREAPPKIDISSHPRLSQERALVDALARAGWSVSLLDVSSREACVVLGVGVRDGAIVLGASAGRPLNAIRKALFELCPCLDWTGEPTSALKPEDVASPRDHQDLFRQSHYSEQAMFLVRSEESTRIQDLREPMLNALTARSLFVKLAGSVAGLQTWRALCPGLVPISFGFDLEPLGLQSAADALAKSGGNQGTPLLPHPFS